MFSFGGCVRLERVRIAVHPGNFTSPFCSEDFHNRFELVAIRRFDQQKAACFESAFIHRYIVINNKNEEFCPGKCASCKMKTITSIRKIRNKETGKRHIL